MLLYRSMLKDTLYTYDMYIIEELARRRGVALQLPQQAPLLYNRLQYSIMKYNIIQYNTI